MAQRRKTCSRLSLTQGPSRRCEHVDKPVVGVSVGVGVRVGVAIGVVVVVVVIVVVVVLVLETTTVMYEGKLSGAAVRLFPTRCITPLKSAFAYLVDLLLVVDCRDDTLVIARLADVAIMNVCGQ